MLLGEEHIRAICEKAVDLRSSRYRVLVVCGGPLTGKTALAKEVCHTLNGRYVDVVTDLLPNMNRPVLGVYGPSHFIHWIEKTSDEAHGPLCIDEIEALVATFGEEAAASFFSLLGVTEPRDTVVVVTRLESALIRGQFPRDRAYAIPR